MNSDVDLKSFNTDNKCRMEAVERDHHFMNETRNSPGFSM